MTARQSPWKKGASGRSLNGICILSEPVSSQLLYGVLRPVFRVHVGPGCRQSKRYAHLHPGTSTAAQRSRAARRGGVCLGGASAVPYSVLLQRGANNITDYGATVGCVRSIRIPVHQPWRYSPGTHSGPALGAATQAARDPPLGSSEVSCQPCWPDDSHCWALFALGSSNFILPPFPLKWRQREKKAGTVAWGKRFHQFPIFKAGNGCRTNSLQGGSWALAFGCPQHRVGLAGRPRGSLTVHRKSSWTVGHADQLQAPS